RIFLIAAALKTGRQAHFHLGINAPGKLWVGMQIVNATPHLEEVERIVHELLSRNPRNKRTIVERTPAQPAKPRSDGSSRIFVFEMQLHKRCEAEPQPVLVSLRERSSQDTVQQETGLEVGAGGSVLDHPN